MATKKELAQATALLLTEYTLEARNQKASGAVYDLTKSAS